MKTEYQISIILQLRKLREELGYSQKGIATILGISPGQLGNIESPKAANKYTLSQIHILCKTFNLPIEQLFLDDEDFSTGQDIINLLITKIVKYGEK
jgi:transcriptional regulator with XRE-family HTH domain